jgi:hypothetical protein
MATRRVLASAASARASSVSFDRRRQGVVSGAAKHHDLVGQGKRLRDGHPDSVLPNPTWEGWATIVADGQGPTRVGIWLVSISRAACQVPCATCMRIHTSGPSPNSLPSRTAT